MTHRSCSHGIEGNGKSIGIALLLSLGSGLKVGLTIYLFNA